MSDCGSKMGCGLQFTLLAYAFLTFYFIFSYINKRKYDIKSDKDIKDIWVTGLCNKPSSHVVTHVKNRSEKTLSYFLFI